MNKALFVPTLAVLVLWPQSAEAADWDKIDRTIAKQPIYQSKAPKYCLLVFGAEAKTRIWLVLDGDVLYVDRNGNGDLTEEGERVAGKKYDLAREPSLSFEAGEITEIDGKTKHQLRVLVSSSGEGRWTIDPTASSPDKRILSQRPETHVPLAERPQDARIIHFGGPLTFALSVMEDRKVERLVRGKENGMYV